MDGFLSRFPSRTKRSHEAKFTRSRGQAITRVYDRSSGQVMNFLRRTAPKKISPIVHPWATKAVSDRPTHRFESNLNFLRAIQVKSPLYELEIEHNFISLNRRLINSPFREGKKEEREERKKN